MHIMRRAASLLLVWISMTGNVSATFIELGNGVVLDSSTSLEWEANANHGPFDWLAANNYANGLTLAGGGWRLPDIYELGDLYAHLSMQTGCSVCVGGLGPFAAIQDFYWSSTELLPGAIAFARGFFDQGNLVDFEETLLFHAWAVRESELHIPEPDSLAIFGLGLTVIGLRRWHT